MKLLECVFERYNEQRVHAKALFFAYKSLYDGIFKRETVWLPNYERPAFLDLLSNIERHLTEQISKFKDYFPLPRSMEPESTAYITSSLDAITFLCRMIDKNPFFKETHGQKKSIENLRSETESTASSEDIPRLGITDYDYRDGKFSFVEKLRGIIQTRSVVRYQQLSELATPMEAGNSVESVVVKCTQLTQLLLEEIEQDRTIYRSAFIKEIDIIPIEIEKFSNLFCLEMENMSECIRNRRSTSLYSVRSIAGLGSSSEDSTPGGDLGHVAPPKSEDDLLGIALNMLDSVGKMSEQWSKFAPNVKINFNFVQWFTPFISRWLDLTEKKTLEWVEAALKEDSFKPQGNGFASSSPTDLFTAIFESLEFLKKWTRILKNDNLYYSFFMTRFAEIAFVAIEHYCKRTEEMGENDGGLGQDHPSAVPSVNMRQTVWNWFSGSVNATAEQKTMSRMSVMPNQHSATCVRISNLEQMVRRLGSLYKEIDGGRVHKTHSEWLKKRAEAYHNANPDRDRESVTGVLRVGVYMAENLKPRSTGLLYGKSNPFVALRPLSTSRLSQLSEKDGTASVAQLSSLDRNEQSTVVAKTRPVLDTLNPRYQVLNPELLKLSGSRDRKLEPFRFLQPPTEFVFAVEDCKDLEVELNHRSESSMFTSFMSSTGTDVLLGRGTLRLNRQHLRQVKDREFKWIELEPQGRVLISISMPIEGVPLRRLRKQRPLSGEELRGSFSSSDMIHYGLGGIEHLDYWFMKMEASISRSRENMITTIVNKMQQSMSTKWNKIVKDSALPAPSTSSAVASTAPSIHVTDTEADAVLAPMADFLNRQLLILSSSLSDPMAQHVIATLWERCVLQLVMQHFIPISFYGDSNTSGKMLDARQSNMLVRCVNLLCNFFHADGQGLGLPMEVLKNNSVLYEELNVLQPHYHDSTQQLCHNIQHGGSLRGRWVLLKLLRMRGQVENWPVELDKLAELTLERRSSLLQRGELIL